ncbi:MAG TPA: ABC transporter permease [Candidatus Sumerlaeota bacterium]|nr:ABC transporter permease [Candidatus Sumerlaeota bacterium]
MLRDLWRVRELLFTLIRRDLLVRYQSSVLGFFWSFAKPLALVAIFHFAFKVVLQVKSPNPGVPFYLHLLVGILVWSYLARCVAEGHWAVLSHSNLIKKVKLPIEVFPITTVAGNLLNFLLGMVVVVPLILLALPGGRAWNVPGLFAQVAGFAGLTLLLTALVQAIAFLVSSLNVFYRDVESLSEVGLQAWFYATPIVYPAQLVHKAVESGQLPGWVEPLYWLNPMTPICVAFRRVLLYSAPPLEVSDSTLLFYLGVAAITTTALFLISRWVFSQGSRRFADEV